MMRLDSVQALRAIAALVVFACHLFAIEAGHAGRAEPLTQWFENGAYGVDLFFVISGFIMVWVAADLPRGLASARDFMFARVTRIYPLWWLFAGTMALFLLYFKGVPWDPDRLDPKELDGTVHLIKSLFLWPQPAHPVLGVGWTLVHEMYFYVGFALLLLFVPARWRLRAILAWGAIVVIGAMAGLGTAFGRNLVELIFSPLTLEFVMGALVGYMIKAGWKDYARATTLLGCVGLLIGFVLVDNATGGLLLAPFGLEDPVYGLMMWGRVIIFGLPAALLLYGLVALDVQGKLRRYMSKSLVRVGDWSYALYLSHTLTISAVGRVVYGTIEPQTLIATLIYFIAVIAATFIVAALAYHYFERPLIRYFRRWRSTPAAYAAETANAPAE